MKETEREKKRGGGGLGTGSFLTALSIEAVRGNVGVLRGPNNSCRSLFTYIIYIYLEPPATSWVRQSKRHEPDDSLFSTMRSKDTMQNLFRQGLYRYVCFFSTQCTFVCLISRIYSLLVYTLYNQTYACLANHRLFIFSVKISHII